MKIRDLPRKIPLEKPLSLEKQQHAVKAADSKQQTTFQEELVSSQKKQLTQRLKYLLTEIDEQGQKLVKLRTLDILTRYKELIKNFLKEVVENLFQLKEETQFDSKGKHKVLVLVKTINKTLEDLVKMVLDREVNNLTLLKKVGEIKGMLIDLYS